VVSLTFRLFYKLGKENQSLIGIGGWLVSRAGLDDMERKILPFRDSNSEFSAVQPVASRFND
jgi:hypothetical protein